MRLCNRAHQTLVELGPRESGPLFIFNDKAMKAIKTSFDRARDKAGVENLRFHDMRHTFVSRLVQGGVTSLYLDSHDRV